MTTLSAFLLGAVSMLLAQLLAVCVLALLCWSGARRAGESLERAAASAKPKPQVIKGHCSCGRQIQDDGWTHSFRGCWKAPIDEAARHAARES